MSKISHSVEMELVHGWVHLAGRIVGSKNSHFKIDINTAR